MSRKREAVAAADALGEQHQLLWRADGQRLEQDGIDERVDGGDGADAQREREHGDTRKRGALPQRADAVTHILPELAGQAADHTSRHDSAACSRPPKTASARRRASASVTP